MSRDQPGSTLDRAPGHDGRLLLIFTKAPRPGRVKTRLGSQIGMREAARLYERMGRSIVASLQSGPYRAVVCYSPADSLDTHRSWLGSPSLSFWPQSGGDLGKRMSTAMELAFRKARRVCVVGTDTPDLGSHIVSQAFDALSEADVVLGPSSDGGYYLLAARRPVPGLFDGPRWGTSTVLATTEQRARSAGLSTLRLEVLSDVDTLADLSEHPELLTPE